MAPNDKIKVKTKDVPFLSQFDGQVATVQPIKGRSGETTLVSLTSGGGIFLTDTQMEAA